jgi:hypothetical protein
VRTPRNASRRRWDAFDAEELVVRNVLQPSRGGAGGEGEAVRRQVSDVDLGFGRIVASEIEAPNMLANLV